LREITLKSVKGKELLMFNAETLIQYGGLLIVVLAVYCQIFFCFFLPSGGLMFTAGVFIASGKLEYSIVTVCILLIAAGVLGNITGYGFGWKAGPVLYKKNESKFFRRQHLEAAENFYKKYGRMALAAGLFFPIIRTFAPIVAGMIKMNFRRFILFTTIGTIGWILSFVLAGYLIGSVPVLKPYLKYIVLFIVVTVTTPIVIRIVKAFKQAGNN
jgi:membrane-associated protein